MGDIVEDLVYVGDPQQKTKRFSCPICSYTTNYKAHLNVHVVIHSSERNHVCDQCDYTGKTPNTLRNHKKMVHSNTLHQCTECDFSSKNHISIRLHVRNKHRNPTKLWKCDICGFETKHLNSLKCHKVTHFDNKPLKCEQCDFVTKHAASLRYHQTSVHMKIKAYPCSKCDFRASNLSNLRQHEWTHNAPGTFKCDVCGEMLKNHRILRVHMQNRHSGMKPHICPDCGKAFCNSHNMKRHRRIHKPKTNKIQCRECSVTFTFKENLRRHMKFIHSNMEKPMCIQCGKTFYGNATLQRHISTVHNKQKHYNCPVCAKTYSAPECLKRHLALHDLTQEDIRRPEPMGNLGKVKSQKYTSLIQKIKKRQDDTKLRGWPYVCSYQIVDYLKEDEKEIILAEKSVTLNENLVNRIAKLPHKNRQLMYSVPSKSWNKVLEKKMDIRHTRPVVESLINNNNQQKLHGTIGVLSIVGAPVPNFVVNEQQPQTFGLLEQNEAGEKLEHTVHVKIEVADDQFYQIAMVDPNTPSVTLSQDQLVNTVKSQDLQLNSTEAIDGSITSYIIPEGVTIKTELPNDPIIQVLPAINMTKSRNYTRDDHNDILSSIITKPLSGPTSKGNLDVGSLLRKKSLSPKNKKTSLSTKNKKTTQPKGKSGKSNSIQTVKKPSPKLLKVKGEKTKSKTNIKQKKSVVKNSNGMGIKSSAVIKTENKEPATNTTTAQLSRVKSQEKNTIKRVNTQKKKVVKKKKIEEPKIATTSPLLSIKKNKATDQKDENSNSVNRKEWFENEIVKYGKNGFMCFSQDGCFGYPGRPGDDYAQFNIDDLTIVRRKTNFFKINNPKVNMEDGKDELVKPKEVGNQSIKKKKVNSLTKACNNKKKPVVKKQQVSKKESPIYEVTKSGRKRTIKTLGSDFVSDVKQYEEEMKHVERISELCAVDNQDTLKSFVDTDPNLPQLKKKLKKKVKEGKASDNEDHMHIQLVVKDPDKEKEATVLPEDSFAFVLNTVMANDVHLQLVSEPIEGTSSNNVTVFEVDRQKIPSVTISNNRNGRKTKSTPVEGKKKKQKIIKQSQQKSQIKKTEKSNSDPKYRTSEKLSFVNSNDGLLVKPVEKRGKIKKSKNTKGQGKKSSLKSDLKEFNLKPRGPKLFDDGEYSKRPFMNAFMEYHKLPPKCDETDIAPYETPKKNVTGICLNDSFVNNPCMLSPSLTRSDCTSASHAKDIRLNPIDQISSFKSLKQEEISWSSMEDVIDSKQWRLSQSLSCNDDISPGKGSKLNVIGNISPVKTGPLEQTTFNSSAMGYNIENNINSLADHNYEIQHISDDNHETEATEMLLESEEPDFSSLQRGFDEINSEPDNCHVEVGTKSKDEELIYLGFGENGEIFSLGDVG